MSRDMHKRLLKRGPTAANQIMQALNTVWNYARTPLACHPCALQIPFYIFSG